MDSGRDTLHDTKKNIAGGGFGSHGQRNVKWLADSQCFTDQWQEIIWQWQGISDLVPPLPSTEPRAAETHESWPRSYARAQLRAASHASAYGRRGRTPRGDRQAVTLWTRVVCTSAAGSCALAGSRELPKDSVPS